jgi:hypothetical protein
MIDVDTDQTDEKRNRMKQMGCYIFLVRFSSIQSVSTIHLKTGKAETELPGGQQLRAGNEEKKQCLLATIGNW